MLRVRVPGDTKSPVMLLNAMLKGQILALQVQNQAHESTSVPIALAGFAKAYSQIQ